MNRQSQVLRSGSSGQVANERTLGDSATSLLPAWACTDLASLDLQLVGGELNDWQHHESPLYFDSRFSSNEELLQYNFTDDDVPYWLVGHDMWVDVTAWANLCIWAPNGSLAEPLLAGLPVNAGMQAQVHDSNGVFDSMIFHSQATLGVRGSFYNFLSPPGGIQVPPGELVSSQNLCCNRIVHLMAGSQIRFSVDFRYRRGYAPEDIGGFDYSPFRPWGSVGLGADISGTPGLANTSFVILELTDPIGGA